MRKNLLISTLAITLSLGLTACAPNISPDVVSASNANEVQTAVEGVIVSKRTVTVKGDSNLLGTGIGAVAGGIAGSTIGAGRGEMLATLGGAVLGGAAGNMAQDKLTTQQGVEYVVKLTQEEGPTTTVSTTGNSSNTNTDGTTTTGTSKGSNKSSTTISSKSAANRYVNVIQGQGAQVLQVGQKVLVAGVNSGHAHIISTL